MALGRPRKNKTKSLGKDFKFGTTAKMKWLKCSKCNLVEEKVTEDTTLVICHMCCAKMGPDIKPQQQVKRGTGFPRGWKLYKEFVTQDGTVYHKGVEQPKLKGKLKPTVIEEKPKLSKHERRRRKEEKELKKMKRLAKQHKKKMKIKRKK